MLGSELLLKCLEKQGVEIVFGIPGGVVIPLYDVLKKSKIKHILTRHEQGAVHAADGYARSSGKVGVCFSTSGPGATNLMTGLATAYMDSSPVVAITGQVVKSFLGKDSFQEVDTTGISMQITKHNFLVKDANDLPDIVAEAFFIATEGRPGPVLIDIPKDVFTQVVDKVREPKIRSHVIEKLRKPNIDEIVFHKALEVLKNARKPIILAGGGVNRHPGNQELLNQFSIKNEIPVAVTLMGKGVVPAHNPFYLGMVGMHGTTSANWAIQNCDCLLAIGVRFDDRVTSKVEAFAPKAKIIHVDIDAAEINKNVTSFISILGDSYDFLKLLSQKYQSTKSNKEWINQIKLNSGEFDDSFSQIGLNPQEVLETVNELLDEDTIVVTDVGQHQMWAALYVHPYKPRCFITSGGLGTMGFGLPAAIGAQMANPAKKVILITGDGSLQMNLQELALLRKWNLPIKIILINNGVLGMVRQWQELFYQENYSEIDLAASPDWEVLAQAYGINGTTLSTPGEDLITLRNILDSKFPWLVNVKVDKGAKVFPMVPAGSSLDEIWGRWGNEAHVSSLG